MSFNSSEAAEGEAEEDFLFPMAMALAFPLLDFFSIFGKLRTPAVFRGAPNFGSMLLVGLPGPLMRRVGEP